MHTWASRKVGQPQLSKLFPSMRSVASKRPRRIWAREGSMLVDELLFTCIAIVGALQSVVGIVAQSLQLTGIKDYSSPIGPWIILWMAVANAFCALSMLFNLITLTFFGCHESLPELILVAIVSIIEIGITMFMLYTLRDALAAVIYLITAVILYIGVLWITAQSYLLHKSQNNIRDPLTTTFLSESPVEVSDTTNTSVNNESICSDARQCRNCGHDGVSYEDNGLLSREQSEANDNTNSDEQGKEPRPHKVSMTMRIMITFTPLFLSLCIHSFLCSQAYFLSARSSKSLTSRLITLYSYLDDEKQTGRYISSTYIDVIRPLQSDLNNYNCITIMLHDQGQDSTDLLPLARNASAIDPRGCLYVLLDRPGYGSSSVGKYPLELITEAKLVNDIALLLAAEVSFDLRESCQLPALYNPDSDQYELIDARHIDSCFIKQGISTDMILDKLRFTCVGHGSGTSVCLTWAKLVARMHSSFVLPVDNVIGLDYFPQQLVLEALYGISASTTIMQYEEKKLAPIRSVIAPFSMGSYMYDTGRYEDAGDYVVHLSDTVPDVDASNSERFHKRTSLCTFSEGFSASISEDISYAYQTIKLDEFMLQNITPPNTTLFLLVLSAHSCIRGPSSIECSLFESDEVRTEVLTGITDALQTELLSTITAVYSGGPDDLWLAPQNIAELFIAQSLQNTLVK